MAQTRKISSDRPLMSINLRRYENPSTLAGRKLIRRICLSLGLLQPGDSRDVIVDVVDSFIRNKGKMKTLTDINNDVYKIREEYELDQIGISPSNILRQIRRLKELKIVMKMNGAYQLTENNFQDIFQKQIKRFIIEPTSERIEEYCNRLDELSEKMNKASMQKE